MDNPVIAPIYQYYAKDPDFRYKYSAKPDVQEGWTKDGTAFFAFGKQQLGVSTVYEYYAQKPKYRFRYSTNPDIQEGWTKAGVGFYGFAATPATPVPSPPAGRYVINQSFETMEQYFGLHLTESIRQQENETVTERTYDSAGLRQVLPKLPTDAKFKVVFINGRAQRIVLGPALDENDSFPTDPGWQAFAPRRQDKITFFEYVFGYRPVSFEPEPVITAVDMRAFITLASA